MFGWRGRILRVNLTSGVITGETLQPAVAREYLGGRGLGLYLHQKEVPAAATPFSSENHLIFTTGPLTGTLAPNGGRYTVVTRTSPSGAIAGASISGKWGPELKFAGYDGIIFEGTSSKPVYLWIGHGGPELRSAAHVAGRKAAETAEILREETHPRAVVSCIGPAGENRVGCAVIVSDDASAAGGTGIGAVMGSKNLKAVIVCGAEGFRVADYPGFLRAATELRSFIKSRAFTLKGTRPAESVLIADTVAWDSSESNAKAARTRGCFGCATSFSAFESGQDAGVWPIPANVPPGEMTERLKEYRCFVDLGLDYAAAKAILNVSGIESERDREELARKLASGVPSDRCDGRTACGAARMDRGPCMASGYMVLPRIQAAEGQDQALSGLMAVLDSAGLCPFLCAGIGMDTIAELLLLATGVAYTPEELVKAGQRVGTL